MCGPNHIHAVAEGEINEILSGHGFVGYLAVIRAVDGAKRKENSQCTLF